MNNISEEIRLLLEFIESFGEFNPIQEEPTNITVNIEPEIDLDTLIAELEREDFIPNTNQNTEEQQQEENNRDTETSTDIKDNQGDNKAEN